MGFYFPQSLVADARQRISTSAPRSAALARPSTPNWRGLAQNAGCNVPQRSREKDVRDVIDVEIPYTVFGKERLEVTAFCCDPQVVFPRAQHGLLPVEDGRHLVVVVEDQVEPADVAMTNDLLDRLCCSLARSCDQAARWPRPPRSSAQDPLMVEMLSQLADLRLIERAVWQGEVTKPVNPPESLRCLTLVVVGSGSPSDIGKDGVGPADCWGWRPSGRTVDLDRRAVACCRGFVVSGRGRLLRLPTVRGPS
jgi:hypothetical protein